MSRLQKEKKTALDWLTENEKTIVRMGDKIFEYAEPALREYKSSKYLCDYLSKQGFEVKMGISGMPTEFVATWGEGKPLIGTYAEYDATPGYSQKPVPHEEPVVPYAPGFNDAHNMLGVAAVVGFVGAKVAMEENGLKGTIKVFGTPAEKLCVGKTFQARDGHYDGFDAFVGWHPSGSSTLAWDRYAMAYKNVVFIFIGKKGGGPSPWTGKNALDAAVQMYTLVNFEKEQVLPHSAWHSINEFMMVGGQCTVAVPHIAQLDYAFRSSTLEQQDTIYDMLQRCAKAAALSSGCEVEERIVADQRTGNPNHIMARLGYRNLEIVGPPKFSEETKEFAREIQRNLGFEPMENPFHEDLTPPWEQPPRYGGAGDDSNEFTWHAPTFRLFVEGGMGLRHPQGDRYPTWVNSALCGIGATHQMGIVAAKTLALGVIELVTTPSELKKAWEEFNQRTAQYKEEPLISKDVKVPIDLRWPEWVDGKWLSR